MDHAVGACVPANNITPPVVAVCVCRSPSRKIDLGTKHHSAMLAPICTKKSSGHLANVVEAAEVCAE